MHPITTYAANSIGNRLAPKHRRPLARLPIVTEPITAETLGARNVASWYPNAVELTALLLSQTEDIKRTGRVTLDSVERGSDHIARHVVRNHRPEGAYDPLSACTRHHTGGANTAVAGAAAWRQD